MYDDGHKILYSKVPLASQNCYITTDTPYAYLRNSDGNIIFTPLHNHKDFEILFIKSGTAHFMIDGTSVEAHSGDLLLVNPYELHFGRTDCTMHPFSFYCVTFDLSMLCTKTTHSMESMCNALWQGSARFENLISNSNEVARIISELENKFESKCSAWEYYTHASIFELFAFLISSGYLHRIPNMSKDKIFVKKVQEYIEQNFKENITTNDAAAALSYDKSYFCRIFRKNFEQTFGEYLNFHRTNYAKELLECGYSVSDAAFSSGYNNTSYFIKQFKKYNSFSPSEYIRNQNRPCSQP